MLLATELSVLLDSIVWPLTHWLSPIQSAFSPPSLHRGSLTKVNKPPIQLLFFCPCLPWLLGNIITVVYPRSHYIVILTFLLPFSSFSISFAELSSSTSICWSSSRFSRLFALYQAHPGLCVHPYWVYSSNTPSFISTLSQTFPNSWICISDYLVNIFNRMPENQDGCVWTYHLPPPLCFLREWHHSLPSCANQTHVVIDFTLSCALHFSSSQVQWIPSTKFSLMYPNLSSHYHPSKRSHLTIVITQLVSWHLSGSPSFVSKQWGWLCHPSEHPLHWRTHPLALPRFPT